MRLLQAACERRDATFTLKDPAIQPLRDWFGIGTNAAGVSVTPTSAEGLPVAFRCNAVIANLVAGTPLKLYRKLDQGKQPDARNALYSLVHDLPNPLMTAFEFRYAMQSQLGLWGSAFAEIERYPTTGEVRALWPLLSSQMKVDTTDGTLTYRYGDGSSNPQTWVWDSRRPPILHLRAYSLDGIHGRSVVSVLRESFGEAIAARQFASSFFADGALGTVFASYPGKLKDAAKQNLRESLKERIGRGVKTGHAIAVLEEGLKVDRLTMPLKDAQFLETRQASDEQIARAFGVPAFLANLPTTSGTYGVGLEQQAMGFLKFTMDAWFRMWESALNRDLLGYKSYETHECLFVRNALVQADITARTQAYERMIKMGAMSPNEARALDDMNPREGGDEYVDVSAVGSGGNVNRQPKGDDNPADDAPVEE